MPGEKQARRIAAIFADMLMRPCDRGGGILHKSGEIHFGIEAIIGDDSGISSRCESLPGKTVKLLRPRLPAAAIEKHDDVAAGFIRRIDVERLARIIAISD